MISSYSSLPQGKKALYHIYIYHLYILIFSHYPHDISFLMVKSHCSLGKSSCLSHYQRLRSSNPPDLRQPEALPTSTTPKTTPRRLGMATIHRGLTVRCGGFTIKLLGFTARNMEIVRDFSSKHRDFIGKQHSFRFIRGS